MENIQLSVKTRNKLGKQTSSLRENDILPAVLYGRKIKNQNIEINLKEFLAVYEKAGESTIIDLKIDEREPIKVLIQDVQKDSISDGFIHADFFQVNMKEKINADIKLKFNGIPPAIKLGGILVKNIDELEVKCLPTSLVHEIEVDLTVLKEINSQISVKELNVPQDIEVLNNPDDIVANIVEPSKEEEEKPEADESEIEGEESIGEETEGEKEGIKEDIKEGKTETVDDPTNKKIEKKDKK